MIDLFIILKIILYLLNKGIKILDIIKWYFFGIFDIEGKVVIKLKLMEVFSLNIIGVYVCGSMIIWENIDLVVKFFCGMEKINLLLCMKMIFSILWCDFERGILVFVFDFVC